MRSRAWLAVAVLCAVGGSAVRADDGVAITGDEFVVTGNVKIKPGVYRIADSNGDGVIHVRGDGTKLDLTGVTLIGAADDALPDTFTGVGVSVDGAKDVTITGGAVRGFKIGVRAHDAPAVRLSAIDASGNFKQHLRSTVEREDESDWLFGQENDDGHWERDYGAGIALKNCVGAVVEGCTVRGGQNGVLLDRCDKAQVFDGDFSFNSGWGVALWRTCEATICRNKADFCVRGYSHGRYARGQDSAGIFVFEQCSRNSFALNSATHGGDGFFLYAGNETLRKTGEGGCNDNVVWRNDFSHAVANGIEATFSRGNEFIANVLRDCVHGVWVGYSYETRIESNQVEDCANGVSIEHGHDDRINWNLFERCGVGVHLWSNRNPDLDATPFAKSHDVGSTRNRIGDSNCFKGGKIHVLLENDVDSRVIGNFSDGSSITVVRKDTSGKELVSQQGTSPDVSPTPPNPLKEINLPGVRNAFLPPDAQRGRRFILVDDWGPIPPTETRLFPATIDAVGAAKLSALGVGAKFAVESITDGFVAEPMSGDMPATIVVHRKGAGFAPKPFEVVVKCGNDVRKARGTISSMPWDVRFFKWTKDPRTDAEAWNALLSGPAVETRRVDGLDFDWKSGPVSEAVGADHFGTLATCEVLCAAGTWRLATVSDDGIRVWIDGKLVVDDWTHHGPTPHDVDLDLAAGKHEVRVEHFEIDGWAVLRVSLAPVAK